MNKSMQYNSKQKSKSPVNSARHLIKLKIIKYKYTYELYIDSG